MVLNHWIQYSFAKAIDAGTNSTGVQYGTDYRCTSNQPPERATMVRPLKSDNYGSPTGKVFGEIGEGACCTPTQAPKRLQVGVVHSAP